MTDKLKVLQLASSDLTISKLLLPLIDCLREEGYQVSAACSDGPYARSLQAKGYTIHTLPLARTIAPWSTVRSIWKLYRLMTRERFDIVHVHTPVAAAVGRIAARLAGVPMVIYTAHGFYFHDRMAPMARRLTIWVEKLLGHTTDLLITQSQEDAVAAVREKIRPADRVGWIGNGVDIQRFKPVESSLAARRSFGLSEDDAIVGFVGRLVAEKGILDLLDALSVASETIPNLVLLVAGDSTTAGDRDRDTQMRVQTYVNRENLRFRTVFTGFIDDIERMMQALDVFVLPSYREGMPRSIIEAMASGKPVVATDIRGCREEVVQGETGLLVPVADVGALAQALVHVLSQPRMARDMGVRGRQRAQAAFDEQDVLARQVEAYRLLIPQRLSATSVGL